MRSSGIFDKISSCGHSLFFNKDGGVLILGCPTGIDWEINDNWLLNSYISWGKTDQRQENGGQINVERAANALDVYTKAFENYFSGGNRYTKKTA